MKRIIGLFIVVGISLGAGILYQSMNEWETQKVPQAYAVLDDLENKGIYQGSDMVFKTLDEGNFKLASLKGKVVVLSFWATWCEPCVEEFPSFIKLLDTYPEDVVLVAISHDYGKQEVIDFVAAFDGQRENMILTMDEGKKLSEAFAVDRLPEGFIFDKQGKLRKKIMGIQDWATPSALSYFQSLIEEK